MQSRVLVLFAVIGWVEVVSELSYGIECISHLKLD